MTTHQPTARPLLAPTSVVLTVAAALTGLLLALAVLPAPAADAAEDTSFAKLAKTFRGDGTLKQGCRNYRYKYKITPPEDADTWALETFLVDRTGNTIASGGILKGASPAKGKERFRFCRENTVPGKFTVRGKFTYKSGFDTFDGKIKPTTFRLRAR